MTTYTTTADADGNFNVVFNKPYTGGQSISVTSSKLGQSKTILLNAPTSVVDPNPPESGGVIQFTGTLDNFPNNVGGIILDFPTEGSFTIGAFSFQVPTFAVFYSRATSLSIRGNVTLLGESSFGDWKFATSVNLPESLVTIETYALSYFEKANSLVIPNNVTTIAASAVRNWITAKSLYLGSKVQSIGSFAFNAWRQATSLVIPESVMLIASSAFYDWIAATSLTLPNNPSLTIGEAAFGNWSSCQEIICLSSTPYSINEYAFYGLPSSCVIKVPTAALNTYKTAPNWSQYASQMVGI